MTFNIGVIIGPILGGVLSDPARSYPTVFGNVDFFKRFPYAAPNLVSAFFLLCAMLGVWLCLEEVGMPKKGVYSLLPITFVDMAPRHSTRGSASGIEGWNWGEVASVGFGSPFRGCVHAAGDRRCNL
jgi:hypothetical protein